MGEEGGPNLGPEDEVVARLSLFVAVAAPLVSGVTTLQGTTTDTPDVDVDALSILGRSTRTLEAGAQSVGSCWTVSPSSKEMFANPSFKGQLIPPLSTSPSGTVKLDGTPRSWVLVRPIVRHWMAMCGSSDHKRTLWGMTANVAV